MLLQSCLELVIWAQNALPVAVHVPSLHQPLPRWNLCYATAVLVLVLDLRLILAGMGFQNKAACPAAKVSQAAARLQPCCLHAQTWKHQL